MNIFVVVLIIVSVFSAAFFWLVHMSGQADPKRRYLPKLEQFVGGRLEEVTEEGTKISRVSFRYKDMDCVFEEVTEEGFYDRVTRRGFLRTKGSGKDLSLSFTEKTRASIRSQAQTIADLSVNWGGDSGPQVIVPKDLKEFNIHTNNVKKIQDLLSDDRVVKVFANYKNLDYRGHPVMSLECNNGILILRFHSTDNLMPSLLEVEHNITSIETHLERLYLVVTKLHQIEEGEDSPV